MEDINTQKGSNDNIETCIVLKDEWNRGEYDVVYCGTDIDTAYEMVKKLDSPMGLYLQVWFKGKIIRKYKSLKDSPYDDRRPAWEKTYDLKEYAQNLLKENRREMEEANGILQFFK